MKCIICSILTAGLILISQGCSPARAAAPELRFGDCVIITKGFFKDCFGRVNDRYPVEYSVSAVCQRGKHNSFKDIVVFKDDLEKSDKCEKFELE